MNNHSYYIKNRIKILQRAKEYRNKTKEVIERELLKDKKYLLKLCNVEYYNKRYKDEMKAENLYNVIVDFDVSFD